MKLKSFRTSAALILATLMLMVAAAITVATAQTYTDLYNFNRHHGTGPLGIFGQGRDGNLYGTTAFGGPHRRYGVVFRVTPSGMPRVLYNFDNGANGGFPYGGLTLGTDGNFYGTTLTGGADGYGTIFKITKSGSLTTLHTFTGGGTDGQFPNAPPIQGTDGSFYGTTVSGGTNIYYGTVYKITPAGKLTALYSFDGTSGADPFAPLLQATDGNFYGTLESGGSNNCTNGCGTIFKITPTGTVTIVYNFDGIHGEYSYSPLIQGSDGNFYGTTSAGGSNAQGVVFKLTPQGAITVLHNFPDPDYPNDGLVPDAGLVQATDGNFYGVTTDGGTMGNGVIFQVTPAGAYSILYDFDGTHGGGPEATLVQHTDGMIYGLAMNGGTLNGGVFYSFDMGLGPFVSLVSTTGKVGKTVEVLGQGFTGTTAVSFNGTAATFTVKSGTFLTAIVPTGATTGFVTVTTPSGTLTSNKQFRVKP